MKRYIFILLFSLVGIYVFGQSPVYPWNTTWDNVEENAYIKDTQNQLLPYTGTWIYTNGSKKVSINFQRIMYYYSFGKKYYMDKIAGRYKVENGSTVVYSDMNLNMQSANLTAVRIHDNKLYGSYFDELNCRILSNIKVWLDSANPNKMYMEIDVQGLDPFIWEEDTCPNQYDANFGEVLTMPNYMVLYKQ